MLYGDNVIPSEVFTEEQNELLQKLSKWIVDRELGIFAVMSLESVKPLNFMGSQAMAFLQPFLTGLFFSYNDYEQLRIILEDRRSIEALICYIEDMEDKRRIELKNRKKELKEHKKQKKEEKKRRKELRKNAS